MSKLLRPRAGVYGPQEIETMTAAYRTILQEVSDGGALSRMSHSTFPARELRRLAAKQVIVVAAMGVRDGKELVSQALERIAAIEPAAAV